MPNHQMSPLEADVQAAISASEEQLRAWKQKDRIERYWRRRGRLVKVNVVESVVTIGGEPCTVFSLQSNIRLAVPAEAAR